MSFEGAIDRGRAFSSPGHGLGFVGSIPLAFGLFHLLCR